MKKDLLIAALAVAMCSCNGSKLPDAHSAEENEAEEPALNITDSKWRLVDYAGDKEMATIDPESDYELTMMPDSTFAMSTDCNILRGAYKVAEDSLTFGDVASTMMACHDEAVEMAMKRILPMVDTYAITPDSMLLLRSDMRTMARFNYAE